MANKKQNKNVNEKKEEKSIIPEKPQSIMTMAIDGQTVSTRIKTTRELYMEQVNDEKN